MAEQQKWQMPQPQPIEMKNVKGNIYLVKGGLGANAGFHIGKKSVTVIDAKMTPEFGVKVVEEIKKLTQLPIIRMIITHGDLDHVNGLSAFPKGMEIISHPNTKSDMEKAFSAPEMKELQEYIPTKTFDKKLELNIDGEKIRLLHFGPGHTSGDVVVYFPAEKIVFGGDLVFIGRDPLVHRQKNGSSFGLVKNMKEILKLGADTFIFGHCEFVSKDDIKNLAASIESRQKKIKEMIKAGKSVEEVKTEFNVQAMPTPPGRPPFPSLIEVMYMEIKENIK